MYTSNTRRQYKRRTLPYLSPERRPAEVERLEVRGLPAAERAERALQGVLEGLPEVPVEVGVDEGIQGRIGVADPEQDRHDDVRTGTGLVVTERRRHVPDEERQPAEDERAHDDAEGAGGLVLALHLHHVLVLRRCVQVLHGSAHLGIFRKSQRVLNRVSRGAA